MAIATTTAQSDAEKTKKVIESMIQAAEQLILEATAYSAAGKVENVAKCVKKLEEVVKLKGFPKEIAEDFKELCRKNLKDAHEKHVCDLFDAAMDVARDGTPDQRKEEFARVTASIREAVKCGADEAFCEEMTKRLDIFNLTTKEGIDEAAKRAAKRKTELKAEKPAVPRERRRGRRYADPVLVIDCHRWGYSEVYRTINWSYCGFLVSASKDLPAVGKTVKFAVRCGLLPKFEEWMSGTVVRISKEPSGFAIAMPEMAPGILKLMSLLRKDGIELEPY